MAFPNLVDSALIRKKKHQQLPDFRKSEEPSRRVPDHARLMDSLILHRERLRNSPAVDVSESCIDESCVENVSSAECEAVDERVQKPRHTSSKQRSAKNRSQGAVTRSARHAAVAESDISAEQTAATTEDVVDTEQTSKSKSIQRRKRPVDCGNTSRLTAKGLDEDITTHEENRVSPADKSKSKSKTDRRRDIVRRETTAPVLRVHDWNTEYGSIQRRIGRYQWKTRYSKSDDWRNVDRSLNEELELAYCDVTINSLRTTDPATGLQTKFHFDRMTFREKNSSSSHYGQSFYLVRSEVDVGDDVTALRKAGFSAATAWIWFWESDSREWVEYDADIDGHDHTESDGFWQAERRRDNDDGEPQAGYTSSAEIEAKCAESMNGSFEFSIRRSRKRGGAKYRLDFERMVQINVRTQVERRIRRRPAWFRSSEPHVGLPRTVLNPLDIGGSYPSAWNVQALVCGSEYQLVPVRSSTDEFFEVAALFWASMPDDDAPTSIWRVLNRYLWEDFVQFRRHMEKRRGRVVEPRRLFHGTAGESVRPICEQGFDSRICGRSFGTKYGQGNYFADNALLAAHYTDCGNMFVVQVLVGDHARGTSNMVRPPPKDPRCPLEDLYDSCVDDVSSPSAFVTFERAQSYPEYLIVYRSYNT